MAPAPKTMPVNPAPPPAKTTQLDIAPVTFPVQDGVSYTYVQTAQPVYYYVSYRR
jgi:hypothetical protein